MQHCVQAVTRQILTIGQELTFAKERVALLDEAPRSNGSSAPLPVRPQLYFTDQLSCTDLLKHMLGPHPEMAVHASQCLSHSAVWAAGHASLLGSGDMHR